MSSLRLALAGALAVLAVLAALAAGDVRAWHSALADGDTAYVATPSRATWTPPTRLGGLSEALLGVRDDVELRQALQLYVDAAKLHLRLDNAVDVESARARAQDALEQVSRAGDPQRTSQVLTLLGILAFRASAAGGAQSQVDAALSDFTDAVRADPTERAGRLRPRAPAATHGRARHAGAAGTGRRLRPDRAPGRGRRAARERLLMTFLTPLCGLVALLALLPLAAAVFAHGRTDSVRRALRLPPPERRAEFLPSAFAAAGVVLLGLAAAQPALTRSASARVRADVQALFVLDTSRSMAASSSPAGPTRLDRAVDGGRPAARGDPAGRLRRR